MTSGPELVVVVGPTASGKSDWALEFAERHDAEIVSADSVQLYRGFDIGSAKPSPQEQRRVPHHLIDCLNATQPADASQFVKLADEAIADIHRRAKRAVVCGGTFLWVRALLYGLANAPPGNDEIRARHQRQADAHGRAFLHEMLKPIDPASYQRLAPNDLIRVSRALEVYELTGRRLSDIQAEHGFRNPRYNARLVGVERSRAELHTRIAQRTAQMFERGFVDEVRGLLKQGYGDSRVMRSVGYRQVSEALQADQALDVAALTERVTQVTRAFVRSQSTWLKGQPVRWLPPGSPAQ